MDYALAKELKDAGFKCEHQMDMDTGSWCVNCPWDKDKPDSGFEDMCFPTLEELIEACGYPQDRFRLFTDDSNMHSLWEAQWRLSERFDGTHRFANGSGSTPVEAVARLWLALNKNI